MDINYYCARIEKLERKLMKIRELVSWNYGVSIREGHPPKMVKQILEVLDS